MLHILLCLLQFTVYWVFLIESYAVRWNIPKMHSEGNRPIKSLLTAHLVPVIPVCISENYQMLQLSNSIYR